MRVTLAIIFITFLFISCKSKTKAPFIKADPKLLRALLDSGFQEDGDTAIQIYTKVISLDPSNTEAYWRRGDEYFKNNRFQNAILDLDSAIAIDSSFNVGYLFGDRGEAYEGLNNYTQAIQDYTLALKFCKTSVPSTPKENFYYYRARAKLKIGDTISASIDTDSALFFWNDFPRARFQKGRLEAIRGN